MCTLTYLPLNNNAFFMTHNRDEKYSRSVAALPKMYLLNDLPVFYPKDLESNGTWMLTTECVFTLCLLNGADEHIPSDEVFPKSRGQIILDYFNFFSLDKMIAEYDFSGYAPFTLIVMDSHLPPDTIFQKLTWDTTQIKVENLDPAKPAIWSSSTLYDVEARNKRQGMFEDFLIANPSYDKETIINFHTQKFDTSNDNEGFVIDRVDTERKTVSLTCISKGVDNSCEMSYFDFIGSQQKVIRIID
jgi:uncharacterized protein with NRDE domain